jgi:hypothetical protein
MRKALLNPNSRQVAASLDQQPYNEYHDNELINVIDIYTSV